MKVKLNGGEMRYRRNFNCGMRDKNTSAGARFAHVDGWDAG